MYQALEAFSSGDNPKNLARLLAEYSAKLKGSPAALCCLTLDNSSLIIEKFDPNHLFQDWIHLDNLEEKILMRLKSAALCRHLLSNDADNGLVLVCVPVRSSSVHYGFLGYVENSPDAKLGHCGHCDNGAVFLSNLAAIVLERRKIDDMAARLLVSEEQNRIANEIHDGVAQHLFSMVYALHALTKKHGSLQDDDIQQQLNLLKKTANQTAKEIRASIYRISPLKRGEQVFVAGISSYFEGIEKLNGVKVSFSAEGSEDTLSPALRKALYRIISEATSNAIRHGKSTRLTVNLYMAPGKVHLQIKDNGHGFDTGKKTNGLGLTNMSNLIASFGGRLVIESEAEKGAVVTCIVPGDLSKMQSTVEGVC